MKVHKNFDIEKTEESEEEEIEEEEFGDKDSDDSW